MAEQINVMENFISSLDGRLLDILLKDNTTGSNILWAADDYEHLGLLYGNNKPVLSYLITGNNGGLITPAADKTKAEQQLRIRGKAAVCTPSWLCNCQNNLIDEAWFGYKGAFNEECNKSWETNKARIDFSLTNGKTWQDYVTDVRLEITCGEGPYLVSRYDCVTGNVIAVEDRIGLLDRKLRVICENVNDKAEWYGWAVKAYQSVYGYEWQGDSLLLARANLLYTFTDYFKYKFGEQPDIHKLTEIAKIISWNVWQMDGLKYVVPNTCINQTELQLSVFEENTQAKTCSSCAKNNAYKPCCIPCKIKNWKTKRPVKFSSLTGKGVKGFTFGAVVGNPPYQVMDGGAQASATPVYNCFAEAAKEINPSHISLIIPSRWMTGGKGLDKFRLNMIKDRQIHKLVDYFDASACFKNVDIKGGVCYFLWDNGVEDKCSVTTHTDGTVLNSFRYLCESGDEFFIRDNRLISIKEKVAKFAEKTFDEIVSSMKPYGIRGDAFKDTGKYGLPSFSSEAIEGGYSIIGLDEKLHRVVKYMDKNYPLPKKDLLNNYKIFITRNYGTGEMGEIPSAPVLAEPGMACTETFVQIGPFENRRQTENCFSYMKTKFFRLMVGIRKQDQGAGKGVYSLVPLQDFNKSWTDKELYSKYNFSAEDINFIESKIKEYN